MRKILCPTDFSEISQNAIAYAAKIAQVANAELILFHEHSLWNASPREIILGDGEKASLIADELESICTQISKAFHISCYADVIASGRSLTTLIEEYENNFDLIVMGIEDDYDFFSYLLGSRAFQVSKNTHLPLILVPSNYVYKSIDRIAFAFDPYEKRETGVVQLTEWAELWNSKIVLLEGVRETDMAAASGTGLPTTGKSVPVERFDKHHTANGIHSFMLSDKADMLALYSRNRGFFEKLFHKSVIKKISQRAVYPVFIFHR